MIREKISEKISSAAMTWLKKEEARKDMATELNIRVKEIEGQMTKACEGYTNPRLEKEIKRTAMHFAQQELKIQIAIAELEKQNKTLRGELSNELSRISVFCKQQTLSQSRPLAAIPQT